MRLKTLGLATIEALETPNQSDARKNEIKSTKKHKTHPWFSGQSLPALLAGVPLAAGIDHHKIQLLSALDGPLTSVVSQTEVFRRGLGAGPCRDFLHRLID